MGTKKGQRRKTARRAYEVTATVPSPKRATRRRRARRVVSSEKFRTKAQARTYAKKVAKKGAHNPRIRRVK